MIAYINHEPLEKIYKNSTYGSNCKYCGCYLYYYDGEILPLFSARKCLTYDEFIIKNIIE